MKPVHPTFFNVPTIKLAQLLLGAYLVHEGSTGNIVGRIVETEAYKGPEDRAVHSYNNRRTKRTEIMFAHPGLAYTYQMHTHTLINIVTKAAGIPHAVLIRAVEPVEGVEQMRINRGTTFQDTELTNGPGKLTQAFEISMNYYGHPLYERPLYIAQGEPIKSMGTSPRVGVRNAKEAADYPWRFFDLESSFVSKFR